MKNATLLKIASLFIFLLSAQHSFAQQCDSYPDYSSSATYVDGDQVHYQGDIWENRYGNNVVPSGGYPNNDYVNCSLGGAEWCHVTTCTSTPTETIAIQNFDGATPDWSYTDAIPGSSSVNLFFENLDGENDGDTTGAASGINWALSGGGGSNSEVYVHDDDHVHMSKNDGTIAVWETTQGIDIASYINLNFTVKVKKTDKLDNDDYVRLLYSKNGGALIEIATYYNDMDDDTIIGGDINSLTGNTLIGNPGDTIKLFMNVRNDSSNEKFEWEEIKLTGIELVDGDCTISSLGDNTTTAWGNSGSTSVAQITFNTVDLSNHDNLNFSFDYFIDSDTEPSAPFEDNFVYDIYYNGSETASLTEELIVDGGVEDSWTSRSVSVPDDTTSIKVIFNYDVTGASTEYLGIDNVKVTGIIKLPGCASYISPTDGATNVSVTPTLSWDAVSGATGYKVYYGTDSSTSTFVGETSSTSQVLPTLVNNTQYFWKVVPTNARGDASGCSAVSFTTIFPAPSCASYISPTDGAIDISLTPELSWSAVSGATGYKVYYSSDSSNLGNPITLGEVTSYQLPQLGYETQYFWKVVPTNAGGEATGCSVISFTTLKNPAGSVFITGNTVTISKNAYLYLEKDFTNTGGSLTLNSSSTEFASIIVEGTATGDVTYNKFVNLQGNQSQYWDLVGSPVLGQDMAAFADTNIANNGPLSYEGNQYGIGQFLTDQGFFENYTGTLSGGTIISTGGSIENAGDFPAAKGFQMATFWGDPMAFTGEVATTTQTINIQNQNGANGGAGLRWNLVANPFPSYLKGNGAQGSTDNFLRVNAGIIQSNYLGVYGWNANGSYDVYNYATGSQGIGTDILIAPGQGFFVAAASTDVAQLQFTPAMRTVDGGDDFISGAPMLLSYNFDLKLFHGNSEKAETKYFFQEGLTLDLDPGYDAGALNQITPLSSRLPGDDQGVNFQINAMSLDSAYNQTVPLVINQEQGQSFRISISNNTLPENVYVYLEDAQNGTLTSLKDQDFELSAESDLSQDGRFYIRFTTQNLAVNDVLNPSSITVFKLNTDAFVTIQGLTPEMGKTTATLYNMLGMKVRSKTLNNTAATQQISTQGLASGVYIINLKAGDQAVSKKVIIQ